MLVKTKVKVRSVREREMRQCCNGQVCIVRHLNRVADHNEESTAGNF